MAETARPHERFRWPVEEPPEGWLLEVDDLPETPLHAAIIALLVDLLRAWCDRAAPSALVTTNLGLRWDPRDARRGMDPDVVVVDPAPPEGELLSTLRVWEPDHAPPRLVVEVVSPATAGKDYTDAHARCARLGARELWIFDPLRLGPRLTGGPFELQIWRRADDGALERIFAGDAPGFSPELGAWVITTDAGRRLGLADDPDGRARWSTRSARRAEAELLVRQLGHRFGRLPSGVVDRIRDADHDRLVTWSERVLDARSLDEVLE